MQSNIFIPKKCKVGFNERKDTYTGFLGYVIYHDGKVWRKEKSWLGWIWSYKSPEECEEIQKNYFETKKVNYIDHFHQMDRALKGNNTSDYYIQNYQKSVDLGLDGYLKSMKCDSYESFKESGSHVPGLSKTSSDPKVNPVEFDNTPMEGFVLNKKTGGHSTGWNHRSTYCRVYDPRGFEIEITIPNLLWILDNTDSIKGKGLNGKFIYGWQGTELVLIPEEAPEYKEMLEFTENQDLKVSKKELVIGGKYLTKSNKTVTYMGEKARYLHNGKEEKKALWFYTGSSYNSFTTMQVSTLSKFLEIDDNFVSLMDKLEKVEKYKTLEIEYEEVTVENFYSFYTKPEYSSWKYSWNEKAYYAYYKEGKSYKECTLRVGYDGKVRFGTSRHQYEMYEKVSDLLKEKSIWQQKTIRSF